MAAGLPDLVDCARSAEGSVELERIFELKDLPRVQEFLASPAGQLRASFKFAKLASGRWGATVAVDGAPELVCQRCMQGFALPVNGGSDVEFADRDEPESDSEREFYRMRDGMVSLRELAEEELLLALPFAAACDAPQTCGKAPVAAAGDGASTVVTEMRRPFSGLQDLLKKT